MRLKRGRKRQRNGVLKIIYLSTVKQCRGCSQRVSCTRKGYRSIEVAETADRERQVAGKLASPEGGAIYSRRQILVEPVFDNLKFNLGFTRFSLRGLARVKGEFLLLCPAHNLKKLAQHHTGKAHSAVISTAIDRILGFIVRCQVQFETFWAIQPRNRLHLFST